MRQVLRLPYRPRIERPQMTETLFMFDKRNYQECQNAFRGSRNQEYYLGDYSIEASSVIDVRADRKTVGSCSIIRLRSKCRLFFRRNWSHIREDGRSEEHTSELQSLMRISYAVFCLKKKKNDQEVHTPT